MYLTDTDYRKDDFYKSVIVNYNEEPKFDASDEGQIQPASIDLRLSNKVWFQKNIPFGKIDVSKHGAFDFAAEKYWKEKNISIKAPLKIKPNETVFCRTHEKLFIPENCCAKIEAKSSIARLSLSVTYSDYCNPKYTGNYPLQIHNSGKNAVVLYPHMEICQLILVKINDNVSISYDDDVRDSIYSTDDDGSPSKWWDSKTNKLLRNRFYEYYGSESIDSLMKKIDNAIIASFGKSSLFECYKKQVYKRFNKFLGKKPNISKNKTFERFFKKEKRYNKFFNDNIWKIAGPVLQVILMFLFPALTFIVGKIIDIWKSINICSIIFFILCSLFFIASFFIVRKKFSELPEYLESYLTDEDIKS
ncbi:MAG: dCTP deaminase [Treponema sp.]|nr:dCTP deaminase [Treponema sp.]